MEVMGLKFTQFLKAHLLLLIKDFLFTSYKILREFLQYKIGNFIRFRK